MALPLTEVAKQLAAQTEIKPNIVLEIEGLSTIFGAQAINSYIRIGDPNLFIGNDWVIGGFRLMDDTADYISFSNGTTERISQKLDPSRAQGSTVTSMTVSLLDKNGEISEIVSPGFILEDVLGRNAKVSLGFSDSGYPDDYSVIFRGVIQTYEAGPGYINLLLNNTEEKKRVPLFSGVRSKLTANVDFRSVTIQDIFYQNREDVTNVVTVQYLAGGTAGSENVTVIGTNIQVQIQNGVSTASQVRKAIENDPDANQLVTLKITGSGSNPQTTTGVITLASSTSIDVENASLFYEPQDNDAMMTYLKIGDEVINYDSISSNTFQNCIRAQFDTDGALHKIGAEAEQIIRLQGNMIDIALKIMLSGGPTYYAENVEIKGIGYYDPLTIVDNAIFFDRINIIEEYGVAKGDFFTITGATNLSNNVVDSVIEEVGLSNDGSYIILSDTMINEAGGSAIGKFKSQFNTFGDFGLKMKPSEVDVNQHLFIRNTFLPVAPVDIRTREVESAKEFLEKHCYLEYACFSVPRKGRSSIAYHIGPLAYEKVVEANVNNVPNASSLKVARSTSENFYNTVEYQYDYNPVTNEYETVQPYERTQSKTRIPVGDKVFKIESKGLRSDADADALSARSARRLLNRNQFGAEYIKGMQIHPGDGYAIEIGDLIAVDFGSLQLTDFSTGNRLGGTKLMEVLNATKGTKSGNISLDLVNTAFNLNDRLGLISPSSVTDAGSTTTKLILQKSYTTRSFQRESAKWSNYLGQNIEVCSPDFSTIYETNIVSFDNNTPQGMLINPALPVAIGSEWIIRAPRYPTSTDKEINKFWKLRHAYWTHQLRVASGASQTQFTLVSSPANIPFVGSVIRLHNYDFSIYSQEVTVTNVSGLTITVDNPLGFVPSSEYVELIGFPDGDPAYRIV